MAIVTRVNGDAKGVVNVDSGKIVAFISKHPVCFKITGPDFTAETGVGGDVETVIRAIQVASTVIMYQVDGTQISVLVEATGYADDAAVKAAIVAAGVAVTAVTSADGFKLA